MQDYLHLFSHNREWADSMRRYDAGFFDRHSEKQQPGFLFIGCCDSRVPIKEPGVVPASLHLAQTSGA